MSEGYANLTNPFNPEDHPLGVQIDIALDVDGHHTFSWSASNDGCALNIAPATLKRWAREHEDFRAALARWSQVVSEIDDLLLTGKVNDVKCSG